MTERQYKRANKCAFAALMAVMIYLAVTFLLAFLTSGGSRVLIQALLAAVAAAVSTVAYKKKGETRNGAIIIQMVTVNAFGIILLFNKAPDTWLYTLPILVTSMVFMDKKQVWIQNILLAVYNLIRVIIYGDFSDKEYQSHVFIVVFVLLLSAYATIRITSLLAQFNAENMNNIQAAMDEQAENSRVMSEVADKLVDSFTKAMDMVSGLENSVDAASVAMNTISDKTEVTSQAVQMQADVVGRIKEDTEGTLEYSRKMLEGSKAVTDTVKEGEAGIKQLQSQAEDVRNAGNAAVEVIERLAKSVDEVQAFVGTIISISGQTNLLSLNASIEAARAGEAGRGFAVVADEIRQLSTQTEDASNSITEIIKRLNEDTKIASARISESVSAMLHQNELITLTGEKFNAIDEESHKLADNIKVTNEHIDEILAATNRISDSIANLSATSEEVASSSQEGSRNAEAAVADMTQTKLILEEIYDVAQKLVEK